MLEYIFLTPVHRLNKQQVHAGAAFRLFQYWWWQSCTPAFMNQALLCTCILQ